MSSNLIFNSGIRLNKNTITNTSITNFSIQNKKTMITVEDVKEELNKIFKSDKWIVSDDDNYVEYPVIWIDFKGKDSKIYRMGFIKAYNTKTELKRILSLHCILRDLVGFGLIKIKCKMSRKTVKCDL